MNAQGLTQPDETQMAAARQALELQRKMRGGISWFFWIAALSIINTALFLAGSDTVFVVGLGITQFIDGFIFGLTSDPTVPANAATVAKTIGVVLDLIIAAMFAAFGYFGRRRVQWVVILGMVLYTLDTFIMLAFQDWLSLLFHALGLFGLWGGLRAMRQLAALEAQQPAAQPSYLQSLAGSQAAPQPSYLQSLAATPAAPARKGLSRTALIVMALIAMVLVAICVLIALQSG